LAVPLQGGAAVTETEYPAAVVAMLLVAKHPDGQFKLLAAALALVVVMAGQVTVVGGVDVLVQLTEVGALQEPLLQAKVALPVVGVVVSESVTPDPLKVWGAVAEQVLVPTVQLSGVLVHDTPLGPVGTAVQVDEVTVHGPICQR